MPGAQFLGSGFGLGAYLCLVTRGCWLQHLLSALGAPSGGAAPLWQWPGQWAHCCCVVPICTTVHHGQTTSHDGQTTSHDGQTTSHHGQTTAHDGQTTAHDGQPTSHDGQTASHDGQTTSHDGQTTSHDGQTVSGMGCCPWMSSGIPRKARLWRKLLGFQHVRHSRTQCNLAILGRADALGIALAM